MELVTIKIQIIGFSKVLNSIKSPGEGETLFTGNQKKTDISGLMVSSEEKTKKYNTTGKKKTRDLSYQQEVTLPNPIRLAPIDKK